MRARLFAAALAALGLFEAWNHETSRAPLVAGAALPLVPAARSPVGPFWLGIAGFWAPRGHELQVAALGWAAHLYARRARAS